MNALKKECFDEEHQWPGCNLNKKKKKKEKKKERKHNHWQPDGLTKHPQ